MAKDKIVGVPLDAKMVKRIDDACQAMAAESGIRPSRAALIRAWIENGLERADAARRPQKS